jgi:hypothetical protein
MGIMITLKKPTPERGRPRGGVGRGLGGRRTDQEGDKPGVRGQAPGLRNQRQGRGVWLPRIDARQADFAEHGDLRTAIVNHVGVQVKHMRVKPLHARRRQPLPELRLQRRLQLGHGASACLHGPDVGIDHGAIRLDQYLAGELGDVPADEAHAIAHGELIGRPGPGLALGEVRRLRG